MQKTMQKTMIKVGHVGKITATALLILGLSNVALAETPEEEIKRLKQENELLELQKKNEELKKGKKSSAESSEESAVVDKSGLFGFCKGEHVSTGCFIGAEVGYSGADTKLSMSSQDPTIDLNLLSYKNTYTMPIKLIFGWQWYFRESMGINIQAHIGYALIGKSSYNGSFINLDDNSTNMINIKSNTTHAINYGLEVQYRYDLWHKRNHTFGLHAGIGYDFHTFMVNSLDMKTNFADGSYDKENIDLNASYTNYGFTSKLGVHYYYKKHHQFAIFYQARGYTISNELNLNRNSEGLNLATKLAIAPSTLYAIQYAYKF